MTKLIKTNREGAKEYLASTSNGTIIIGDTGVGKTTLVKHYERMVSATILSMEFQSEGIEGVKNRINNQIHLQGNVVVIDDLGAEEDVKHFGNGLCPIRYTVQAIYDINQRTSQNTKLIFTTNLNKEELTVKYGLRVVERIWEMCDRLVINDTNLRN